MGPNPAISRQFPDSGPILPQREISALHNPDNRTNPTHKAAGTLLSIPANLVQLRPEVDCVPAPAQPQPDSPSNVHRVLG